MMISRLDDARRTKAGCRRLPAPKEGGEPRAVAEPGGGARWRWDPQHIGDGWISSMLHIS